MIPIRPTFSCFLPLLSAQRSCGLGSINATRRLRLGVACTAAPADIYSSPILLERYASSGRHFVWFISCVLMKPSCCCIVVVGGVVGKQREVMTAGPTTSGFSSISFAETPSIRTKDAPEVRTLNSGCTHPRGSLIEEDTYEPIEDFRSPILRRSTNA